jgi:hypothetical protein
VTGYLVAEEILELAQVGGKAPSEPVAEFAWDRGVADARSSSRQESSQPGAPVGSPSRIELKLASR